jgi:hypothetical protein
MWNDKPIPLELHHKDGDHFNNELSNLQILCPNCHAQQSNNSGSAVGSYATREEDRKRKLAEKKARVAAEKASGLFDLTVPVNTLGVPHSRMLSDLEWSKRKELILNSGIDLQKFGWKTKVQEATGLTRRQVDCTIEHFADEFKDKIYIR